MKTETGVLASVTETATVVAPKPLVGATAQPNASAINEPADVRLVIEEDSETGAFIYKTLDRRTGEVILQLPRADVLKALHTGGYAAGDVIKTRA